METIGKVLSITLLTLFVSAAATVYLVDNNILPTFLGNVPVTYTSDSSTAVGEDVFRGKTQKRQRVITEYEVIEALAANDEPVPGEYKSAIWGRTYDLEPKKPRPERVSVQGHGYGDSTGTIEDKIEYWRVEYLAALESGRQTDADRAYRNYKDLEALEIK